jgi:hypothetical protein
MVVYLCGCMEPLQQCAECHAITTGTTGTEWFNCVYLLLCADEPGLCRYKAAGFAHLLAKPFDNAALREALFVASRVGAASSSSSR